MRGGIRCLAAAAPRGCGQIPHGLDDLLYRGWMRSAWGPLLAAALIVASALTGCAPVTVPAPATTASATATDAPVFASDAEALAAATKAYAAYLAASDASWAGESTTRDDFLALSTGQAHEADVSAAQLFDDRGWRKIGRTLFDSIRLQTSAVNNKGDWEVRAYLCLDVSDSDVVDDRGISVAKANRPLRLPLEVEFVTNPSVKNSLLIQKSNVWSGSDFC